MNAEPARRYQLADLVNAHLGAVQTFERAPCNEPTVVYRKRNRFEQCLVLAIERAIDKILESRTCPSAPIAGYVAFER